MYGTNKFSLLKLVSNKNILSQLFILLFVAFIGFSGTLLSFRAQLGNPKFQTRKYNKKILKPAKQKSEKKDFVKDIDIKKSLKKPSKEKVYSLPQILKIKKISKKIPKLKIIVDKSKRRLYVFSGKELLKEYKIGLGKKPIGLKLKEGDKKTPEGIYYVNEKKRGGLPSRLGSRWIRISYPNWADALRAYKRKNISKNTLDLIGKAIKGKRIPLQSSFLGGGIGIHGDGSIPIRDFTRGCIGLINKDIEEIFPYIKLKTPVIIYP